MGDETNQDASRQTIGSELRMNSTSQEVPGRDVLINTDSMASDTLPSQIPSVPDNIIGSSVDRSFEGTELDLLGPWTSTQKSNTIDESDDRMYGEEGAAKEDRPMCEQQEDRPMCERHSSDQRTNFSVGPNFSLYANASDDQTSKDSSFRGQTPEQSADIFLVSDSESGSKTDSTLQQDESMVTNERKSANTGEWSDTSIENEMLKCGGERGESVSESVVHEVREKSGSMHDVLTPTPSAHTTSTSNSAAQTQQNQGWKNVVPMMVQTDSTTLTENQQVKMSNTDNKDSTKANQDENPTSHTQGDTD